MSRMTKFLRQTCWLHKCLRDEKGNPKLNEFGEIQYDVGRLVRCRHEVSVRDVQTSNGSIIRSTSVYYVDEIIAVDADDMIDGKVVVSVSQYVNALGRVEGYEVYV